MLAVVSSGSSSPLKILANANPTDLVPVRQLLRDLSPAVYAVN
ncbi:hypothetical protein SNOG_09127 [Parastagonospora nodorum SN15]|uniref:Uncharacterized protein n=1 Tax=Phaeosphaeria nodorum (strain SN15 / ATCC MYA-4574 / FGSC 10173) TaxID=321614 RepID=Q0UGI7_PHANO|nr:hypothetical protein SNOG_09127 [Parastagonospora nodorum SN15]EAT83319.1 hypothetical protein SNOG_09127 [Parastagonospora nodorum SN15]